MRINTPQDVDSERRAAVVDEAAATADRVRERLVERWGDVSDRGRRVVEVPEHGFPESADRLFDWAALALVTDGDGRVLLLSDDAHPFDRELPGGRAEAGDRPAETARREVREETGIDCAVTGLLFTERLAFDYGPPERPEVVQAVFAGEYLNGRAHGAEPAIRDAGWFGPGEIPAGTQYRERIRSYLAGES